MMAGGLKPKELLEFLWINIILGNLKTSLGDSYHAASRYLAAFSSIRCQHKCWSRPLPLGLVQLTGFDQLKHLANQVNY